MSAGLATIAKLFVQPRQFDSWVGDLWTALGPSGQQGEGALRSIRIHQQSREAAVAIVMIGRKVEALMVELFRLFERGWIALLFAHGIVSRGQIVVGVGVVRVRGKCLLERLDGLLIVPALITAHAVDVTSDRRSAAADKGAYQQGCAKSKDAARDGVEGCGASADHVTLGCDCSQDKVHPVR